MKITRALSRAEVVVYSPPPESVLVSINDTHGAHYEYMEDLALRPWRDILWMRFDDVGAGERGAMTEEQARQICDFVVLHGNRNIITHCSGGISRSGGVSALPRGAGLGHAVAAPAPAERAREVAAAARHGNMAVKIRP